MKHPTLFRVLLTLACAIACLYAQMAVDAMRGDNALFAAGAMAGACLTLPLIRTIRNRYTRRAWPDTLLALIAGSAACSAALHWKATLGLGDLLTLLSRQLHWAGVVLYAWCAAAMLGGGLWLFVAMQRWWRTPGYSGHAYFSELALDSMRAAYPLFVRAGGVAFVGAFAGGLLGALLALVLALAGLSFALLPFWLHVLMRLSIGGLFGWLAARWHVQNLWRKSPPGFAQIWRESLGPWLSERLSGRGRRRAY